MSKNEFSNKLSVCEEMIMSLLLDSKEDLTLQEVTDKMKIRYGRDWKLQTVATFMTRIEKKGYISIYRIGRYSHYHAEYTARDMRMKALREVADVYFNGSFTGMRDFVNTNGKTVSPGDTVYYLNKKISKIVPMEVETVTLERYGNKRFKAISTYGDNITLSMEEVGVTWYLSEEDAKKALA